MEFRHGVKLVREALREYADHPDDDIQWLAKRVDEALSFDGAPIAQFFVLCMSEAKDDLSQWRAYGGGENGVSIELSAPLLQPMTQNGAALRPVVYVEDAQHGLAADIAKWTVGFFKMGQTPDRPDREKWADSFLANWEQRVIYLALVTELRRGLGLGAACDGSRK